LPTTAAQSRMIGTSYRSVATAAQRSNVSSGKGMVPASRAGIGSRMGGVGPSSEARPMTSVSGAGYKGSSKEAKIFDPLNIGRGPAPPLAVKSDNSNEDKAKEMEKKVHRLIESTATAIIEKDLLTALEKAKEAGKAERALCKFRETHNLGDQINFDLTYAICVNLANAYYYNKMYEEALNTYQMIVKNKQYPQSGRLRINMGNIYYEQKKYPQAIKMYRMALDQIPSTGKELRYKIIRNIGNAFVKLGQFQDAIESYETIVNGNADMQTAFNMLLCLFARGDIEKMKKHFLKMLSIPVVGMTEEDEDRATGDQNIDQEDSLKSELHKRLELSNERVLMAARLIAPAIDDKRDWENGYKWVIDQLRTDYENVLSKFEIDLSMMFMKKRRYEDAISVLKSFERKDRSLRAIAGTNLSFIYFLEGDFHQAEKHADAAIKSDRYNAKALVNKGNCLFVSGELSRAREMYLEAVGVEADCVEAIYNLGLVNLKLNNLQEAQSAFDKLNTSMPAIPEALYHLGQIYENGKASEDLLSAAKTYQLLLNKVPGDPSVCCKLGQIYEKLQEDSTACHWHTEAHRYYPVNLNVTSWLGVWYVKREMYEQAIEYFQHASVVQPGEIKWQLMVTSCYRRIGDLYKALELYEKVKYWY
jgi:intraflagellar transport protein 88